MRVLQVTPYFAPAWAYGGPPRVMYEYAAGLVRLGHEVRVLATDVLDADHRAAPRHEVLDGVEVTRLPNLSNALAWRRKKYLPLGLPAALAREARRFDVVHTTDTRTFVTANADLGSAFLNVPLCVAAFGSLPESTGVRGLVKRSYDRIFVRPMLRRAALLLAQTAHEAALYTQLGASNSRVRLLPLPVTLPPPVPAAAAEAFRRRLGLSPDDRVALFLGRIHALKGLDILAGALEPLLERDDGPVLVVVGRDDGQWRELARRFRRQLARGAMRFAGPVYGDERYAAYAAADVFCLTPRHWEETSLAALEAAACGTPVVVSEQADIPGLEDAGGGFVVPLDPPRIRAAVTQALERSAELGANARALISRQHETGAVVKRLEGCLLDAVSGSAA